MKTTLPLSITFLLIIILFSSCREDGPAEDPIFCPQGDLRSLHTLLGNPSNALNDISMPNNYLMEMDEYTISYNRDKGIPNWVSWHLSKTWFTGDGNRQDDFRANPFLPDDWYAPSGSSYELSGFDRGHNCPSADRVCSDNFNSATFFMTNMIPQSPQNNQQIWANWECYIRELIKQGNEAYIIMGNYGVGGDGFFGYRETIDEGRITVPESVWKVAVIIPEGDDNDLEYIDGQSTIIAIDVPNSETVGNFDFNDPVFITTVDEIEANTGYDLLSNLSSSVQNSLESKTYVVDNSINVCF